MKIYNFAMERLLARVYKRGITPYVSQRIWEKKTLDGNPFWGSGDFCGISVDGVIKYGRELTDLEWEGNELFFSHEDPESLENEVIAAYLALKKQLEEDFSGWTFDLVVSIDEENHTGRIRFYNIRDGYHYIEPTKENLARFQKEAILVETVNKIHLENDIPLLAETLSDVPVEIQPVGQCEIRIQDLTSESHINISWDDEEFTMYFDSFHCHYWEDEWDMLVDDVRKIIAGRLVAGRAEKGGRWLGSYLLEPENVPITRNGGTFSVTAWDTEKNRTYLIRRNGICEIRAIRKEEYHILEDFLYEAIFIPEDVSAPPKEIINKPELQVYIDGFGKKKGDRCLVAEINHKIIGAAWVRIMNDYGHIDDETPSFAISLYKDYRSQGIGTALMENMLEKLRNDGYKRCSLAVQKANYAVRMYKNVGFEIISENEEEYIMVCNLCQ